MLFKKLSKMMFVFVLSTSLVDTSYAAAVIQPHAHAHQPILHHSPLPRHFSPSRLLPVARDGEYHDQYPSHVAGSGYIAPAYVYIEPGPKVAVAGPPAPYVSRAARRRARAKRGTGSSTGAVKTKASVPDGHAYELAQRKVQLHKKYKQCRLKQKVKNKLFTKLTTSLARLRSKEKLVNADRITDIIVGALPMYVWDARLKRDVHFQVHSFLKQLDAAQDNARSVSAEELARVQGERFKQIEIFIYDQVIALIPAGDADTKDMREQPTARATKDKKYRASDFWAREIADQLDCYYDFEAWDDEGDDEDADEYEDGDEIDGAADSPTGENEHSQSEYESMLFDFARWPALPSHGY